MTPSVPVGRRRRWWWAAAALFVGAVAGAAWWGLGGSGDHDLEPWVEDLESLDTELRRRHLDLFHTLSSIEWAGAVADLRARISNLTDVAAALEVRRLVALVGDAHTYVAMDDRLGRYPIVLASVSDGVAVVAASPEHSDLVGALVTRVRGVPIEDAVAAALPYVSADNDIGRRRGALGLILAPEFLDLALPAAAGTPSWTFLRAGAPTEVTLTPIPTASWRADLRDSGQGRQTLWESRPEELYWWTRLDGTGTVYVQYNVCAEDPERPFAEFTAQVFGALGPTDRLVVDLRRNTGGDSSVFQPFLARLADHPVGRNGELFVLIGPRTFSSAVLNAVSLDQETAATLVGEPTGGAVNGYGETHSFTLPNSGIPVLYSTKYFQVTAGNDAALLPNVTVVPDSADIAAGRDPVLDWVLSQDA